MRWGWDPVVQFLASRGFAVFQPNYRGSTGYGREHERMGYGQWGLAMQDDLADGVRWLVAEGIANPTRVGIYGIGYGGYAALLAAAKTPELFRAAASFGAVTDLVDLLENPDALSQHGSEQPRRGQAARRSRGARGAVARAARRADPDARARRRTVSPTRSWTPSRRARWWMRSKTRAARSRASSIAASSTSWSRSSNRIDFHEKLAAFFARHLAIESL